ncbi:MAG: formate dehydrogenase subunit delta [Proteobacteria bacterium]|nr:formate dehydrogenase subunit delta [Pseudomonadota bacterium]
MDIDNLLHMANRIAEFFESMPDADEGARETAVHLRKFWEPRMRAALLAHVVETGGEGLRPLVLRAVTEHRAMLEVHVAEPADRAGR